ncbi:MAG: GldG family protein, partial [Clostridiales bacterium]|nr:GldG family protein [Clostridiales bacterium]
ILGCLAIASPLDDFTSGVMSVTGIIYYVTGSALFLFFTCQLVQKFRWSVSSKKIARGMFNSALIVIVAAIVVVVNVLAAQLPDGIKELDVTSQKLYTLTDDTYDFLDTLDQDVTIYVLETEDGTDEVISKMLTKYEDASDHISVEYIDPAISPNFYTNYTDSAPSDGSLIVVSGDYSEVIDYYDIYEYSMDYSTYSYSIDAYDGEGQVTSAIAYVTSGDIQTVYTIAGHGETSLDDSFTQAMTKMNLSVEDLTLLTVDEIPDDAAAVIINGPTTDFSSDDAAKLSAYLANGGQALITTSIEVEDGLPNLDAVLADYGIEIEYGVVMEGDMSHCYQYPFFLLPDVDYATETSGVSGYVMMPYSQGIVNTAGDSDTLTWTTMTETSDDAYLKTGVSNLTTYDKEGGDMEGPFDLAVKVEDSDSGAAVTVVSSVLTFTDQIDEYVSGQNLAFFKGIAGNYSSSESNISIDAKNYTVSNLSVNQAFIYTSMGLLIIAFPVVLIVIGIIIWLRRRKA